MAALGESRPSTRIEIKGVSRFFGWVRAVCDLSFTVEAGEFLAILGPSGCGKTTILRLIAGLERPDRGAIVIGDDLVADDKIWVSPERRGVGMVFQDYALFPHLTVAQNIAFGLNGQRPTRVQELLKLVGLDGFARRYPHELSGGEQQRVAIARSLATHPKVLLLDEPFSNLDADLRPKMRAELKILLQRLNCTTIFVTHDQEEAFELADRIAVLNAGQLEQIDAPEEIYREPATRFVAEFIGHADFLKGRVRGNCIETAIGCFAKPRPLPEGATVQVMVRPEEIDLTLWPPTSPLAPPLKGKGEEGWEELGEKSEGLIIARHYRGGMQLITVRLSSGEALRSLQPAGVRFPLASRVGVQVKTHAPMIFY
jgi:iron(III) transport system ATP-binding protein